MNDAEKMVRENIMMRVRFIYGLKSLPRVFVPKLALLASLVAVAGFFVSLPNVLRNMPSLFETPKFFAFITAAFFNTKFGVQVVAIGTLLVFLYMLRDIVKTFRLVNKTATSLA